MSAYPPGSRQNASQARRSPGPAEVTVISFGYGHGTAPVGAHITVDVRRHFRDPHVDPALRYLDATDKRVRNTVLRTPGVRDLVVATVHAVQAFRAGSAGGPVSVAVGCAGGRHRAPAIAMTLASCLKAAGIRTAVHHRDIGKPVIERVAAVPVSQKGEADAPVA
jgi:RNase adaptor protein for sRNA GlmZ degradation